MRAVLPSAVLASSGNWMRGTVPLSPALPGCTMLHTRTRKMLERLRPSELHTACKHDI
jgi:hypothetical protein